MPTCGSRSCAPAVESLIEELVEAVEADEAPARTATATPSAHPLGQGQAEGGAGRLQQVAVKEEPAEEAAGSAQPEPNGSGLAWTAMHGSDGAIKQEQQEQSAAAGPTNGAAGPANGTAGPTNGAAKGQAADQVAASPAGAAAAQTGGSGSAGETAAVAAAVQQQVASLQQALAAECASEVWQQPGEEAGSPQAAAGAPPAAGAAEPAAPGRPGGSVLGRKRSFGELSQGSGGEAARGSRARCGDSGHADEGCQAGDSGAECRGLVGSIAIPSVCKTLPHLLLLSVSPRACSRCRSRGWREPGGGGAVC